MNNTSHDLALDDSFVFEDLGAVEEVTGVYADGNNRDGGWESGHNYSYN